jgi:hypothetical protein
MILTEVQIPKNAKFGLFSLLHGDRLGNIIGRFAIGSQFSAVSIAAMLSNDSFWRGCCFGYTFKRTCLWPRAI